MSCCGQRRAVVTTSRPTRQLLRPSSAPMKDSTTATPLPLTAMRQVRSGTVVLQGPQSRRIYVFVDRRPEMVESADVAPLLQTGLVVVDGKR